MTWFSFQGGYGTIDFTGAAEKEAVSLGFHGYATQAQAKAQPNSVNALQGPALTLLIDQQAGALPSGLPGSGAIPPATGQAVSNATGLAAIGAFFSKLGTRGIWTRIAKVVVGAALILVGVVQLTHAQKVVTTVGKAAALA